MPFWYGVSQRYSFAATKCRPLETTPLDSLIIEQYQALGGDLSRAGIWLTVLPTGDLSE